MCVLVDISSTVPSAVRSLAASKPVSEMEPDDGRGDGRHQDLRLDELETGEDIGTVCTHSHYSSQ